MSTEKIDALLKQAETEFSAVMSKVHVERKQDWHNWLRGKGDLSCFVCGEILRGDLDV